MAALTVIAPEAVCLLAGEEWLGAHMQVRRFHDYGFPWWTTKHALFSYMGGYSLDFGDGKTTIVMEDQIIYLIERNLIVLDRIRKSDIANVSSKPRRLSCYTSLGLCATDLKADLRSWQKLIFLHKQSPVYNWPGSSCNVSVASPNISLFPFWKLRLSPLSLNPPSSSSSGGINLAMSAGVCVSKRPTSTKTL